MKMKRARWLLVGLVALVIAACATAPAAPPSVDVTGRWAGTWIFEDRSLGNGQISMTLKQTGAAYSGDMVVTGTPVELTGPTQGTVSGNELRIGVPYGLNGTLTVKGDEMAGVISGANAGNVTLRRQK